MDKKLEELKKETQKGKKNEIRRRNTVSKWIQRGCIVLMLTATFCLSILGGFNVLQIVSLLLLMVFVIEITVIERQKSRRSEEKLQKCQSRLAKWEAVQ